MACTSRSLFEIIMIKAVILKYDFFFFFVGLNSSIEQQLHFAFQTKMCQGEVYTRLKRL